MAEAPAAAATTTTAAPAAPASPGKAPAEPAVPGTTAVKTQEAKATPPKTYEVKVNGKIRKYSEEEMVARARMADAADERFNEAAQIRKQAEGLVGRIRTPEQMMEALLDPALGLTKDQVRAQFEAWYEREFIEPEKLTEDQKKLRAAEAQIKKYAEQEKDQKTARDQAERDQLTVQARGEIQKQIIEALETNSLPKTNFTVRRLAYWIQRNQENGFNAPTSLLVSQVRNEFNASIRDMVESSDGEALVQLLGDGIIQKLRKYDLDQLRKLRGSGTPPAETDTTPAGTGGANDRKEKLTSSEVTARLRNLQRTGRY